MFLCLCTLSHDKGHFTHETESLWPLHFNHSHWWKRWNRSEFASHYAWGTNGVYKWMHDADTVYTDSYMASSALCFMLTLTIFKSHLLEVGLTQLGKIMALQLNAHNRWFILFCHGWGTARIAIHWNSIWLRARSHMTSHYTWEFVGTLHDFGGVLGRPLDTFSWAFTISLSWHLACR